MYSEGAEAPCADQEEGEEDSGMPLSAPNATPVPRGQPERGQRHDGVDLHPFSLPHTCHAVDLRRSFYRARMNRLSTSTQP